MRNIARYTISMIKSIRHKGLLQYYTEGNGARLPAQFLRKINRILDQLDAVSSVEDIQTMGSGIHALTGDLAGFWSVKITANYRIIFRFEDDSICDVDFLDYH
jgi:toxin HigB-1